MNAKELLDMGNNSAVLINYYRDYLIGCSGSTHSRLYLDLDDNTLFESCFADCNSYLRRDDGSLVELHQHNNYGRGLSDEELDCLERDGVGDFGFEDFYDEIEYAINVELNHRQKIKKRINYANNSKRQKR